jgi:hypothetical protein
MTTPHTVAVQNRQDRKARRSLIDDGRRARTWVEPATATAAGRYPSSVGGPDRIEQRLRSLESRLEDVATDAAAARRDAAAARYLAAAHDRDLADVGVKVDAHRRAINALGEQTAARIDLVDARIGRLETDMRSGFATSAVGHEQIVGLLNHVIARLDDDERA